MDAIRGYIQHDAIGCASYAATREHKIDAARHTIEFLELRPVQMFLCK
jgi:hypothetical protein